MSANERFSKQEDIKKLTKITQNWVVFLCGLLLRYLIEVKMWWLQLVMRKMFYINKINDFIIDINDLSI